MKIYVIGLGPGDADEITPRAKKALEESDVVAGYTFYIQLIEAYIDGKEVIATAMRKEVERCELARDKALESKVVAMVSSGDAGIYGMAGLMHEVCSDYPEIDIEVISGITAASSGGAVLGAPLTHDFAVISLSDLLTPWEIIEKRLELSAQADFCICLYNPSSVKRADYLSRACKILLRHKGAETPCGTVKNIGRENEAAHICSLGELEQVKADMFTTVFIGNSQTKVIGEKMVTPRGYRT